jgi:histidinol-phosphate phosphatase family protein
MKGLRITMRGVVVQWTPRPLPPDAPDHGGIAFIDRDGVLNVGSPNYINAPDELVLLPEVASSIGTLRRAGYKVCIVTNQSPIMRGLWGVDRIHQIHDAMRRMLLEVDNDAHFDAVLVCPHRHRDRCQCRKPMPGMLRLGEQMIRHTPPQEERSVIEIDAGKKVHWWNEKIQPNHELDAMIGDRNSDMGAGWAQGMRCFKVNWNLGIASVVDRVLDQRDKGDAFDPMR